MDLHALLSGFMGFLMMISAWLGISLPQPALDSLPVLHLSTTTEMAASSSMPTDQATNATKDVPSMMGTSTVMAGATSTALVAASAYQTGSAWLATLPLGDGDYVTAAPKKGYIYLCHVTNGGQGAQVTGSWIHGNTWTPAEKIAVEGSVSWPSAKYSMTVTDGTRLITSNGLPTDRTTGIFPIQASDPAYQIDRNPNTITAQDYSFSLPVSPSAAASPGCIYGQVGIMDNGVPLFDAFDNENRDAVAREEQDSNQGHPDESGVYHYHGFTDPLKTMPATEVVGFAFDGYPITGPELPSGKYLTTSDLDECHGLTSAIMLDGKSVTTYHYILTEDFPYSVSCFHGKSFEPKPGGGSIQQNQPSQQSQGPQGGQQSPGGAQGGNPPAPPQAAIDVCTGKSSGAACTVSNGPSGICATLGTYFACKPN